MVPAPAPKEPHTPPCSQASEVQVRSRCCILFRPENVAHRREFGHWEGDLMLFEQKRGQTNVTSLVERFSRFTLILNNPNKQTKRIIKTIKDLPLVACLLITFDCATVFVSWPHLQAEISTQT